MRSLIEISLELQDVTKQLQSALDATPVDQALVTSLRTSIDQLQSEYNIERDTIESKDRSSGRKGLIIAGAIFITVIGALILSR